MSNDRVSPVDQFGTDIRRLLTDIEDYKQFARSGEDSVRMYRVFSNLAADVTKTGVTFKNTRFRLTFTPDDGANQGLVYKMEYTYTESSGAGISSVNVDVERENVENLDGSQSWLVSISGSDAFPNPLVTMKFYFWASGTGTFSTSNL
jgi:hypothetical protein